MSSWINKAATQQTASKVVKQYREFEAKPWIMTARKRAQEEFEKNKQDRIKEARALRARFNQATEKERLAAATSKLTGDLRTISEEKAAGAVQLHGYRDFGKKQQKELNVDARRVFKGAVQQFTGNRQQPSAAAVNARLRREKCYDDRKFNERAEERRVLSPEGIKELRRARRIEGGQRLEKKNDWFRRT